MSRPDNVFSELEKIIGGAVEIKDTPEVKGAVFLPLEVKEDKKVVVADAKADVKPDVKVPVKPDFPYPIITAHHVSPLVIPVGKPIKYIKSKAGVHEVTCMDGSEVRFGPKDEKEFVRRVHHGKLHE